MLCGTSPSAMAFFKSATDNMALLGNLPPPPPPPLSLEPPLDVRARDVDGVRGRDAEPPDDVRPRRRDPTSRFSGFERIEMEFRVQGLRILGLEVDVTSIQDRRFASPRRAPVKCADDTTPRSTTCEPTDRAVAHAGRRARPTRAGPRTGEAASRSS